MPQYDEDKIETYSYTRWAYPSAVSHQKLYRGPFREALGFIPGQDDDDDDDPEWATCSVWGHRHVHAYDVSVKKGMYIVTSDSLISAAGADEAVVQFGPPLRVKPVATKTTVTGAASTRSERTRSSHHTRSSRSKKFRKKESRLKDHSSSKTSRSKPSRSRTSAPDFDTAGTSSKTTAAPSSLPVIPEEPIPQISLSAMIAANYKAAGRNPSMLRHVGFRGLGNPKLRRSIWREYEAQRECGIVAGVDRIQTMPGADGWDRFSEGNPYLKAVQDLVARINDGLPRDHERAVAIVTMLPVRSWSPNGFYDMIVELGGEGEYEDLVLYQGRRQAAGNDEDEDEVIYRGRRARR
ncbi:hypothetical protein LQW54_012986 [Pestalotiopsis sp. IQ-011]